MRAPAGFVDRVVAAAGAAPRRAWGRWLFQPLRVKVPLEAAALLLVGLTGFYLWERTPEIRQAARQEAPIAAVAPAPPAAPAPLAAPAAPATVPVPQDRVSPEPRSWTRSRVVRSAVSGG